MKIRSLVILLILSFMLIAISGCKAQNASATSTTDFPPGTASSKTPEEESAKEEESTKQELQKQLDDLKEKSDTLEGETPAPSGFDQIFDQQLEDMQEALDEEILARTS